MGKTQKRARKKSSQAPGVRDGSAIAKPTHATADATTDVQVAVAAAAMAVDDARDDGARSRDVSEGTILRALLAQSCVDACKALDAALARGVAVRRTLRDGARDGPHSRARATMAGAATREG